MGKPRKGFVGLTESKPLYAVPDPKDGQTETEDGSELQQLRDELQQARTVASEAEAAAKQQAAKTRRAQEQKRSAEEHARAEAARLRDELEGARARSAAPRVTYGTKTRKHVRKRDNADVVEVKATVLRESREWMKQLALTDSERWANVSSVWQEAAELMREKYSKDL